MAAGGAIATAKGGSEALQRKARTITEFLLQRADFYHWTHRGGSRPNHSSAGFHFIPNGEEAPDSEPRISSCHF